MASWPGTSRSDSALASFAGDSWEDKRTRSEIYAARPPHLPHVSSPDEDYAAWTVPTSTITGTHQQLLPGASEITPPLDTSTRLLFGNPTEEFAKSHAIPKLDMGIQNPGNIHEAQSLQPSTLSQYSDLPNPVPVDSKYSGTQLESILFEVATLQKEVITQRTEAKHLRTILRHQRDEEGHLRLALRDELNLLTSEEKESDTLTINKTIESLQEATASYLALECEYQKAEDELEQKEDELDKRMTQLTSSLDKETTSLSQHNDDADSSEAGSSIHYVPNSNPHEDSLEAAEYQSLVENIRLLRERFEDLELTYMNLVDQQPFGDDMVLDNNAQLFLDQYDDERDNMEEELNAAIIRLERHPGHGKPRGDVVPDEELRDLLKEYLPEIPEDEPLPDLLRASEIDDQSPFFETARPMPMNKSNFVNHWLLYSLRHSAVEILHFKSQPELLDLVEKGWDRDAISQMAMRLWYEDGTTRVQTTKSNSGVEHVGNN